MERSVPVERPIVQISLDPTSIAEANHAIRPMERLRADLV
jgi:hypothetical protein